MLVPAKSTLGGSGSTTANALATTTTSVNVSNAAAPDELEQQLEITSLSPLRGSWKKSSPRRFNVKRHGLKGDGIDVWGASINTGTNVLTVTGANFPIDIAGKFVGVEGAGAGGGWLMTTASGWNSPTQITLAANASTTISSVFATKLYNAFYGTNDNAAWQALVYATQRDGSGNYLGNVIHYFPDGMYILADPLKTAESVPGYAATINPNSQILYPGIPPDTQNPYPGNRTNGNMSRYRMSFTIEGETPPHWMQSAGIGGTYKTISPVGGVRIRSTIQGSGTYPSIVCAKGGGTTDGANGVNNNRFGPDLIVKNICFQYTASSTGAATMCGVNGEKAKTTHYTNCAVYPHNLDLQDSAAPATVSGLISAASNDEPYSVTEKCNVGGFKYGYLGGEHFTIRDSSAWCCEYPLALIATHFPANIDYLEAHDCKYGITALGKTVVTGTLAGEVRWFSDTAKWYTFEAAVNDPSNYIHGELALALTEGTVGYASTRPSKIGGANLRTKVISDVAPYVLHTGTTYTLQYLYEAQQVHNFSNAAAITLTIPRGDTATVAGYCYNYDLGAEIKCIQGGAGQVTPTAAAGVTLRFPTGKTKSAGQYSEFTLRKIATNTWSVSGDLA